MQRVFTFLAVVCCATTGFAAEKTVAAKSQPNRPNPAETAKKVDELLLQTFQQDGVKPTGIVQDEDFLRRVSLDLTGSLPSPSEVTSFGLNSSGNKRAQFIDAQLGSPRFGELWASYWADVIFLRATEARSRLGQPEFEEWMETQLNENRPWTEITRELLTATGDVREAGQTGLIFAHSGAPEELASEATRIFMGVQMSCANCHDHPTDIWKREQFHHLAAYFTRITVRNDNSGDKRTFHVESLKSNGGRGGKVDPAQTLKLFDRNRDKAISKDEAKGPLAKRFDESVARFDVNKDGKLNLDELTALQAQAVQQPGRGSPEYYMPDLKDPSSKGTLMSPSFFLTEVKGPKVDLGDEDLQRRSALADYYTSKTNPWYARSFVNRIWGELLGQGFCNPIDDLGDQREFVNRDVLDLLSSKFVDSGYDIKWLYRVILNTQAYQRQLAPTGSSLEAVPFAAATTTRLRADQVYHALYGVLDIQEGANLSNTRRPAKGAMAMAMGLDPQKASFSALFGFDPSTPQADLTGSIPQALFMMNSSGIDNQVRAAGKTRLAKVLESNKDNAAALDELYLIVFSRMPSKHEVSVNLKYLQTVGNRNEGFEDILWTMLNSTEFLTRR